MNEEKVLSRDGDVAGAEIGSVTAAATVREDEIPKERDFDRESKALAKRFPELLGRPLPDEVVMAALRGEDLVDAYMAFVDAQENAEKRRMDVERQNERSASRAPVLGVSGGSAVGTRGEDDFLRGFHADD